MGGVGDNPVDIGDWMRDVNKDRILDGRRGNPFPRVAVLEGRRIDRRGSNFSIADSASGDGTDVRLDVNVVDTIPDLITYDSATGIYTVDGACRIGVQFDITWQGNATGNRVSRLWWKATAGGATWFEMAISILLPGSASTFYQSVRLGAIDLAVGNVFKWTARQSSGGSLSILGVPTMPAEAANNYTSLVSLDLLDLL